MKSKIGHQHPITQMISEINSIFAGIGFTFVDGPEAETEHYNFDLLNVPKDHPSRDMQDTFWFKNKNVSEPTVLRTQTSPVQARYMEEYGAPCKIIVPGKVFRNEATDATHEAQFYQLEGLHVGKDVHLGHLKGTLEYFFSQFFDGKTEVRFRPSFFPFVEPGVEVDMVHPNVLQNSGVDPEVFTGYAFGMGIDRLGVMKYGIEDIRDLYTGDLRFVNQF